MRKKVITFSTLMISVLALVACSRPVISIDKDTESTIEPTTTIVESTDESTSIEPSSDNEPTESSTVIDFSTTIEPTQSSTSIEPTQSSTSVEPTQSSSGTETTTSTDPIITSTEEKHTVSFVVDDNEISNKEVVKGNTTTLPSNPSKSGFKFDNWYIKNTNTIFSASTVINNNIIVEARFIQMFTITFSSEYSTHSAQAIEDGKKLTFLPSPTYAGYTFEGWYTNTSFKNKFDINEPISSNIILYAYWKQVNTSNDSLTVKNYSGYTEGAYIEINNVSGYNASDYKAYYKLSSQSNFTRIDNELIRLSDSTIRADFLGLTQGNYTIKIELPALSYSVERPVVVTSDDRSGYAHFNYNQGVGAYNNDGSLKANAQVIYVTEANKNTVTAVLGGETYTGISAILQNQSKSNNPLVIRIIGAIGAATWKSVSNSKYSKGSTANSVKGLNGNYMPTGKSEWTESDIINGGYNQLDESKYSKLNGLTNKIKWSKDEFDSYYNMCDIKNAQNVTVEGVGTDATLFQWGFTWKNCSSIEVKNLTFTDYTEDACSFEGPDDSTTIAGFTTGHIWVHNNTFNKGINYFDVCYEQDKHDGDGATDLKKLAYVTISYNHYYKNHKTGLVGGSDTQHTACVTFHHNFYDQCQARLPFARQANMHMYNNYYYGSTGNNMQIYAGAFALIENCYFKDVKKTFVLSNTYGVAAIKSYNNTYDNCSSSGATIVTDRDATVTNGNVYNQSFDINSSIFYFDSAKDCSNVEVMYATDSIPTIIPNIAGAGKLVSIEKTNIYNQNEEVVKHTISFNTNGGNTITSIEVKDLNTVSSLPTPERTNYLFGGWYTDLNCSSGNEFSTSTPIKSDITLYAKWIQNVASWTTVLNETFNNSITPTQVTSTPTNPGIYCRVVNINNESDTGYSTSTNYVSVGSNKLSVMDTEETYTTFGFYIFNNTYTTDKVKYTVEISTSSSNTKWSMVHFLDGQSNISIRSDDNKHFTYVKDGNNSNMNQITSTTLVANTNYTISLEIDYTNSIAKVTVGSDSVIITDYTPSAISGIMFQTASAARNVYCTNIKIETA